MHNTHKSQAKYKAQQGISLLEVLVSLVLVALVAVTAAASSLRAQQGQQQAYETSLAAALGQDLIERIRAANPADLSQYQFSVTGPDACPVAGSSLASQDLHDWCIRASEHLPQMQLELVPATASRHFDLTLSWQPRLASGGYFTSRSSEGVARSQLEWQAVSTRVRHDL